MLYGFNFTFKGLTMKEAADKAFFIVSEATLAALALVGLINFLLTGTIIPK